MAAASSNHRLNLARKYRPQSLSDVQGQAVAVKTLSEALKKDRIAPAYLFSGPRGTGKTTCARIFARAATCLSKNKEARPCNECASCLAHAAGRFMDLIEIDGASHTGVDDVRSIIDAVAFRPSVGAKTVHIIDEVHMLSNAAFNALLKTLEEPPPHALFLFATTEQEKIPSTILSRVQRIEMQRLKESEILQNLSKICKQEGVVTSEKILDQISAAADGSLRDAQTLLEQLILLSGSLELDQSVVDSFLGTIGTEQEIEILELISKKEISPVLEKVDVFFQQGKDLTKLLGRLLTWSRIVLLVKSTNSFTLAKKECAEEYLERLSKTFEKWSLEDVDRLFEILWSGFERIKRSELPRITLETTLIRAARIPLTDDLSKLLHYLENEPVSAPRQMEPSPQTSFQPRPATQTLSSPSFAGAPKTPTPPSASATNIKTTEELLAEIKKKRPSLFAIVNCAETKSWQGDTLSLRFPKGHFAYRQASEKILQRELLELVQEASQGRCQNLQVDETSGDRIRNDPPKPPEFMKEAQKTILNDPSVQKAAQLLGGKIESLTISGIRTETKPSEV